MGELGLAPAIARGLDWVEVDHYLYGYETRRQKELSGHRDTAYIIYRALGGTDSIAQFQYLPAIDGPRQAPAPVLPPGEESYEDFKARLKAQNEQKFAAQAAP